MQNIVKCLKHMLAKRILENISVNKNIRFNITATRIQKYFVTTASKLIH